MFELICHVEIRVVEAFCLPHFPKDLQPALPQAPQSGGMTSFPWLVIGDSTLGPTSRTYGSGQPISEPRVERICCT